MFGVYSNQRLTENERKILDGNPDDYNWYCVVLNAAFKDDRFFQIREDIELPQEENDNGVVLMFEQGDVVYFKTVDGDVGDEEFSSIIEVCTFLEEKFKRRIDVYVLCPSGTKFCVEPQNSKINARIFFTSIVTDNGEEIIERLEAKLDSHEYFNISDSIDHMLLPYLGYKNKEKFRQKLQEYMKKVDEYALKM